MGMHISMHINEANRLYEGELKVDGRISQRENGVTAVHMTLTQGVNTLSLFFDNVADMEKLELTLTALIHDVREAMTATAEKK